MRKLKAAGAEEIAALPGFGPRTAASVLSALHGSATEDVTGNVGENVGENVTEPATGPVNGEAAAAAEGHEVSAS